ncbi:MAG TPA: phosphoribosylglycinamide formyltransferase [Polyangiaceae bacterium]|nr:phosphoribosylglycinamide formyltransferase [Polyangiaceae bacterium]
MAGPLRIGVLASHEGTILQAILDACAAGEIPVRVVAVVSNNSDSGALRRARAVSARAIHLSAKTHPEPGALDLAIAKALLDEQVEVVMLAGYMKKLGAALLGQYRGRILNTHPALLPKFGGQGMYGVRVHEAVLRAGETESGPSVHLVDAEYDTGRVLAQAQVPVLEGDTVESLAARVQERERRLVVAVLGQIAHGELELEGLGARD